MSIGAQQNRHLQPAAAKSLQALRKSAILLLMVALCAGCGVKRPLQIPGHEKYKTHSQEQKAPTPASAPTSAPAPAASSNPSASGTP